MNRTAAPTRVTVWNDYVCPWAYLGRHRTRLLESLGCVVTIQPFELHPDTPPVSVPVRPGGRLAALFDRIAIDCADVGVEFRTPTISPNTRLALRAAELVRSRAPERFADVDAAIFDARFVRDRDIGDADVLRDVLATHGVPRSLVDAAGRGEGDDTVRASIDNARDLGIAATPTWRFESGFVIPGVQPIEQVERWARRIIERCGGVGRITPDG